MLIAGFNYDKCDVVDMKQFSMYGHFLIVRTAWLMINSIDHSIILWNERYLT